VNEGLFVDEFTFGEKGNLLFELIFAETARSEVGMQREP
jgi:hypothetical protein